MTARSTTEWTEELEEVFGENGKQGTIGEQKTMDLFDNLGIEYRYNPTDRSKQLSGLDIEILINGVWHGIDVKANIHNDGDNQVCIDYPKLKLSKATFWIHINIEDHLNDYIIYPVRSMIELGRAFPPKKDGLRWVFKDAARGLK